MSKAVLLSTLVPLLFAASAAQPQTPQARSAGFAPVPELAYRVAPDFFYRRFRT